ncbi:TRL domain-containing protein [Alcanivorax sp. UBA3183]|uniref:TRL domain-containing protein n=1 Tax=Alcanivorax sp. UBA3183 TaxID=1945980 RepID=UPI0039C8808D
MHQRRDCHHEELSGLGYFAFGDASTAKAKQDADIARVGTVDVKFKNILGLYGETTTTVCGD